MTETPDSADDLVSGAFRQLRSAAARGGRSLPPATRQNPRSENPSAGSARAISGNPNIRLHRRRPRDIHRAGEVLESEIRRRGWQRELSAGWIVEHWEELVGSTVAAHSRVDMFKDSVLFITCDSTAWATNLRLLQATVLRTIAEKAGRDVVSELRIFGPKAPSWRKGPLHVPGRGPRDTYG